MMMLLTTMSILLILQKEKGILHTINVSLFYFLCFPPLFFFLVCSPTIDNMKHNTGIMVQQTHMTGRRAFSNSFFRLWFGLEP